MKVGIAWTRAQPRLAAGIFLFAVICLICDFYAARAVVPNADVVQSFNELLAVNAGHMLLGNWVLAPDNFSFTDLPFYVVLEAVFGHRNILLFIVPFVTFATLLGFCCLIAACAGETTAQGATGIFAVLVLLGPALGPNIYFLFQSDYHIGTITLSLAALAVMQRIMAQKRFAWHKLLLLVAPIFAIAASDPFAQLFYIGPAIIFLLFRFWLYPTWRPGDAGMLAGLILAGLAGIYFIHLVAQNGGFTTDTDNITMNFAPRSVGVARNFHAAAVALQILFAAKPVLLAGIHGRLFIAAARFVILLLVIGLNLRTLARMPRAFESGIAQCLVLGALLLLIGDVVSANFSLAITNGQGFPDQAIRYTTPAYVFMSLAAAVELQSLLPLLNRPVLGKAATAGAVILGCAVLGAAAQPVFQHARQPSGVAAAPQAALVTWLAAHGLHYGTGEYWATQLITALSNGKIQADAVVAQNRILRPLRWLSDTTRVDLPELPQFVVFQPGNQFAITLASITASYGRPVSVYTVGPYVIAQLATQ